MRREAPHLAHPALLQVNIHPLCWLPEISVLEQAVRSRICFKQAVLYIKHEGGMYTLNISQAPDAVPAVDSGDTSTRGSPADHVLYSFCS